MRKFILIIICIFFLAEDYISLASMPIDAKITGCIEKGILFSEETDFGTHKVNRKSSPIKNKINTVDKDFKPIDLSPYEGKKVEISGSLLPRDTFIIEQNDIKVLGLCNNKKESSRGKDIPEKSNLSFNGNNKMIDEDKAQRIILGLPEVKKHSERVKKIGKRLFTRIDNRFDGESGDKFFYIIYLGEDHGTHAVNLMTFFVNAYTEDVYVYDPVLDSKYPLEQWRMMR